MPVARRKEIGFRLPDNFSISDYADDELRSRYRFGREYTDDELRSRYRFGRESTAFLVDLLRDDLESISNPFRLENPGVSSRISIIFSLTWKGCFGAGPSPALLCFSLKRGNFFHLSLTSCNPLLPSSHRQLVVFPPFSFHAIFLFSAGFSRVRPFSSAHA